MNKKKEMVDAEEEDEMFSMLFHISNQPSNSSSTVNYIDQVGVWQKNKYFKKSV